MSAVDSRRVRTLREGSNEGPVVYWMSRDQRVKDNWALTYAAEEAHTRKQPLLVFFALSPGFLGATLRQYDFMLRGLEEVEAKLREKDVPFYLRTGEPPHLVSAFVKEQQAGLLVTDFDPLSLKRQWKQEVLEQVACEVVEVDAHNVVPCWIASPKQEFAAYTIRPKLRKLIPEFLTEYPKTRFPTHILPEPVDWEQLRKALTVDTNVRPTAFVPGEAAAADTLSRFIEERLPSYEEKRNDPNEDAQSDISPYLHFGQISAQRIALCVKEAEAPKASKEAYLEELIVRRELSDNFCYYNKNYDNAEGFPDWAKKTLKEHAADPRPYLYDRRTLEAGSTHDELWNASQRQMVRTGKMHGYMRMYWAKKILEWSPTIEEALATAIYLNDRYELDGRDPNGYTGIAWSIGGVHDRAWFDRPIFGKIRYMSAGGAKGKFDVTRYCERFPATQGLL